MKKFNSVTIIVPWDFSELSKEAMQQALEIADSRDQIEIVHVTPYPSSVEPGVIWGTYSEAQITENLHKSFLKELDSEFHDLKFTSLFGDPGSQIGKFAEEKNAGLIVISSHGRKGIPRMLLGSVAERVARLSPCPVLVLRKKKSHG